MAKEKETKSKPDTSYWESLGWMLEQSLGQWFAEKQFEGVADKCRIGQVDSFEELENLLQTAEEEYAKNSDGEKGLAVLEAEFVDDSEEETEVKSETEPEKQQPRMPSFVMENCKVNLEDNERLERSKELTSVLSEIDSEEENLKQRKKEIQAKIDDLEKQARRLRFAISSGYEYRDVECIEEFNHQKGLVTIRRVDTDELVRTRQMKDSERQLPLW